MITVPDHLILTINAKRKSHESILLLFFILSVLLFSLSTIARFDQKNGYFSLNYEKATFILNKAHFEDAELCKVWNLHYYGNTARRPVRARGRFRRGRLFINRAKKKNLASFIILLA